jgi:hypothetical protein
LVTVLLAFYFQLYRWDGTGRKKVCAKYDRLCCILNVDVYPRLSEEVVNILGHALAGREYGNQLDRYNFKKIDIRHHSQPHINIDMHTVKKSVTFP